MMFHSCDSRDYIRTYSQIHVYIFEEDDKGGIQIIVMTALFMYTKDKVQGIYDLFEYYIVVVHRN